MTAVTDNTLVVEAVPMSNKDQSSSPVASVHPQQHLAPSNASQAGSPPAMARPSCALCGHCINTPLSYQYRLTDTANESRTICPYCRTRLTTVCNFYSVLRMISKRIISSSTTPEKLYLDFLRIRLSMFMARCGVGIVTGEEAKPRRDSTRSQVTINQPNATHALPPRAPESTRANNGASGNVTASSQTVDSSAGESKSPRNSIPLPATITTTKITPAQATLIHKGPSAASIARENALLNKEEDKAASTRAYNESRNCGRSDQAAVDSRGSQDD